LSERDHVTHDDIVTDMPLQASFLDRLPRREYACYQRACSLLSLGGGVRSLVIGDMPLAGPGVLEALLAQSWAVRFSSPKEMVSLAETALEISLALDQGGLGPKYVADLQARAWGELANAYRVGDKLRLGQHAFGQAYALLPKGTGDPYLKAHLLDLEASLLGKWREFPLALSRLRTLSNLYRDLDELHLAGRTFIIRALYTFYSGDTEEALQLNEEGLDLIDRQRDPSLLVLAIHNHLLFLVDLGHYGLAKRVLFENRRHLLYQDRINALKLRGIEGRISYGLGQIVSAEMIFRELKQGFDESGLSFSAALMRLELAMVLVHQDRVEEAEQEVIASQKIFFALEIYREYLGALLHLQECFQRREATVDLIEFTIAYLWRKELQRPPRHPQ
jgi:tetratricopeptide (TPR) repeat protein